MVAGKHLGRFAMMQVPAIVVEKKGKISIRLHTNTTCETPEPASTLNTVHAYKILSVTIIPSPGV